MNEKITISIVTPSYNQGQFLEETIKSVLEQKGDFYIDYIIADGGSNDNSLEIIKKYDNLIKKNGHEKKCLGISYRWWSKKDNGQTQALNQGFKISNGDILAWINSDDYFMPDAFQKVTSEYQKEKFDFLYGDCFKLYSPDNKMVLLKPNPNETLKTLLSRAGTFEQQSTFFTKKITAQVGYLDESLNYCMDYDFWIKIFKIGKIKYLPETLAVFRIWQNSKTSTSQKKFNAERQLIAKRYGGNIITPKSVVLFIDKFRWRYLVKNKFPNLYYRLKKFFFLFIDLFKYKSKN